MKTAEEIITERLRLFTSEFNPVNSDRDAAILEAMKQYGLQFKETLLVPYRLTHPWSLKEVLRQLVKATDILLKEKGYDGNTYEEMQHSSAEAKEIIEEINSVMKELFEIK